VTEHVDVVEPEAIAHGSDLLDTGGHGHRAPSWDR
jgi:hypothetical protein